MNLKHQLNEDMKAAMKAKDATALAVIRMALAEIKRCEIDLRKEADNARVLAILGKMMKQRKESAALYEQGGRADLAARETEENRILSAYLPQMLTGEALAAAVSQAVADSGAQGMADMGKVMALLKSRLDGRADMAEANRLAKAALNRQNGG